MSDERRQYIRYFNKDELKLLRQLVQSGIDELAKETEEHGREKVREAYQETIRDYRSMLRKLQEDDVEARPNV
jgi:hypothetical protein